ncbi:hypothetical protein LKM2_1199 [Leptospira kirschneri serovar Mozdok]|nr:hypothetical protein [Leptospira kirschneri serovar Mozdok]
MEKKKSIQHGITRLEDRRLRTETEETLHHGLRMQFMEMEGFEENLNNILLEWRNIQETLH